MRRFYNSLMQDEHLTHEWLDALDAIDSADLKPAIELLIGANPPPEVIVSKLRNLVADKKVRFPIVKPGRPTGASSFSLSQSTELSQLRDFLSKHSGKQIRFVEEFMCEELGTNINYLRKAVRLGKNLLKLLEEREHKYEKMTEEELQKNYPELFCNIHKL